MTAGCAVTEDRLRAPPLSGGCATTESDARAVEMFCATIGLNFRKRVKRLKGVQSGFQESAMEKCSILRSSVPHLQGGYNAQAIKMAEVSPGTVLESGGVRGRY